MISEKIRYHKKITHNRTRNSKINKQKLMRCTQFSFNMLCTEKFAKKQSNFTLGVKRLYIKFCANRQNIVDLYNEYTLIYIFLMTVLLTKSSAKIIKLKHCEMIALVSEILCASK